MNLENINIDKDNLENINIDREILKNIDKEILQNFESVGIWHIKQG